METNEMELKDASQEILSLFNCDSIDMLPRSIEQALQSQNVTAYFERYKEKFHDLSIDWLQRVYQFYLADRENKKQDYTPVCLAKLVALLSTSKDEKVVYDCCCGSGALTIQKWCYNNNIKFVCEELDDDVLPILLFNLCIRNIDALVINKDILLGNVYKSYKVKKGSEYGILEKHMFPKEEMVLTDTSISNPPFNLSIKISESISKDLPNKYTCNYAFVSHCMQRSNRCAIILPMGALSSKNEIECRKYFIDKGWLDSVISLPDNIFESTSVPTCILVLDKGKKDKNVMLVNAREICTTSVREQRGEGKIHSQRIYKKSFNTLSDEQIYAIIQLTKKEQKEYSKLVSYNELEEHDYNLLFGHYKGIELEGTIHRDFNDIIHDINRVIRERNIIKVTVNKKWADELGLSHVINDCLLNKEIVTNINNSLEGFENYNIKEKIIEDKYIQSSASKVFVIENTDKELLSSIMPFFINMYKQHIYYLNNEENRLLAELRDSMLPLLMNGSLTFK